VRRRQANKRAAVHNAVVVRTQEVASSVSNVGCPEASRQTTRRATSYGNVKYAAERAVRECDIHELTELVLGEEM